MASFAAFPVRANLTLSHGRWEWGTRAANIRAGKRNAPQVLTKIYAGPAGPKSVRPGRALARVAANLPRVMLRR